MDICHHVFALVVVILAGNYGLLKFLFGQLRVPLVFAKLITEGALFSYRMQKQFVFVSRGRPGTATGAGLRTYRIQPAVDVGRGE